MLASPFTFYRGAAAIMARDLADGPDSGLRVQLCGDAHLSNFGVFLSPERRLIFDINDFDETLPGPFEWDLKRLAASVEVAARNNGFSSARRHGAVLACARSYRVAMRGFAEMNEIDVWYARLDATEIEAHWRVEAKKSDSRRVKENLAKARNKDSLRALRKLTEVRDGKLRIADRPPLLVPIERLAALRGRDPEAITRVIEHLVANYRETLSDRSRALVDRYRYVDAAHKVVGVGSVGTRAWIALLLGRGEQDPLFLQIKEAGPSVLEPYAGPSRYLNDGQRVVAGQHLTQAASDAMLGWLTAEGFDGKTRDFYVRQLWDGKGSAEIEAMSPQAMASYAALCGWNLARAHARTGDPIAISAYLGKSGKFDRALAEFSVTYADQTETDYRALREAERAGKIEVERGL